MGYGTAIWTKEAMKRSHLLSETAHGPPPGIGTLDRWIPGAGNRGIGCRGWAGKKGKSVRARECMGWRFVGDHLPWCFSRPAEGPGPGPDPNVNCALWVTITPVSINYTVDYYSPIKRKGFLMYATTWISLQKRKGQEVTYKNNPLHISINIKCPQNANQWFPTFVLFWCVCVFVCVWSIRDTDYGSNSFYFYLETRSWSVAKLPSMGLSLKFSCLSFPVCWDHVCGPTRLDWGFAWRKMW